MRHFYRSAPRVAACLAIFGGALFMTAEANATKNITVISQSSAKKLCGRAWDGHGCILVGKNHDHAINCYNGKTCHNVHVPPPTRTVQPGKGGINTLGGSRQTGGNTNVLLSNGKLSGGPAIPHNQPIAIGRRR
jgi:hypothetical protein